MDQTTSCKGQADHMYYRIVNRAKIVTGIIQEQTSEVCAMGGETSMTNGGVVLCHWATSYKDRPSYPTECSSNRCIVTILSAGAQ